MFKSMKEGMIGEMWMKAANWWYYLAVIWQYKAAFLQLFIVQYIGWPWIHDSAAILCACISESKLGLYSCNCQLTNELDIFILFSFSPPAQQHHYA